MEARLRRAEVREGHRRRHRLPARLRGGRLLPVPHGARVRLLVRARPLGAFERGDDVEGRDHARRQRPRALRARGGRLARADVVARAQAARPRPAGGARGQAPRGEVQPQAHRPEGGDGGGRQAARRRQLRHRARDGLLGLGDSEDGVGVAGAAPERQRSDPGSRRVRGRWEAIRVPFSGQRGGRHARHETPTSARGPQPQQRNAQPTRPRADIRMPNVRRTDTPSGGGSSRVKIGRPGPPMGGRAGFCLLTMFSSY